MGFNPFGGFGSRGSKPKVVVGDDINVVVHFSIYEAYAGGNKTITFTRKEPCHVCNGTGSSDGLIHKCTHCNGTGVITETSRRGNMFNMYTKPCPYCKGTGKEIKNTCKNCKGTGLESKTVSQTITFPKGIFDGLKVSIGNYGSFPQKVDGAECVQGQVIINIVIDKDSYFKVEMPNIIHEEEVKFTDALLGCEREIRLIDGTIRKIKIPEGTKDGYTITVPEKGMPIMREMNPNGGYGDYKIVIKHCYPSKFTNEQKKLLKQITW